MGMWNMTTSAWSKPDSRSDGMQVFAERFSTTTFAPDVMEQVRKHQMEVSKLEAYRRANAAKSRIETEGSVSGIVTLNDIAKMQNAPEILQPYLVAMPDYRERYNKNQAAGFERGFAINDGFRGNAFKHTDSNYREVTSTMVTEHEDKVWTWVTPDDRFNALDGIARTAILATWKNMEEMDWSEDDMLSQTGSSF